MQLMLKGNACQQCKWAEEPFALYAARQVYMNIHGPTQNRPEQELYTNEKSRLASLAERTSVHRPFLFLIDQPSFLP